jgi:hypothetical protein
MVRVNRVRVSVRWHYRVVAVVRMRAPDPADYSTRLFVDWYACHLRTINLNTQTAGRYMTSTGGIQQQTNSTLATTAFVTLLPPVTTGCRRCKWAVYNDTDDVYECVDTPCEQLTNEHTAYYASAPTNHHTLTLNHTIYVRIHRMCYQM